MKRASCCDISPSWPPATTSARCGDLTSTGQRSVSGGASHTVSELANDPTNHPLSMYSANISCQETVGTCSGNAATRCTADATCSVLNQGTCNLTPTAVASCTNCTSLPVAVPAAQSAIVCTITNNDIPPSLTLVKVVVTDDGGTAVATDWTLTAGGPTPISGAGGTTSGATFSAGSYDLSESGPTGYSASAWVCEGTGTQSGASIALDLGESATCTITNDDQPAHLIVTKVIHNDHGLTKTATDFSYSINGQTAISFEADASNDNTVNALATADLR